MNMIADTRALAGAFALGVALALTASSAARAELVVVEQTGTTYTANQKLGDDAPLNVPAGARLKLKRLPDGANVEVAGPHKGPLATYKAGADCNWWNPLCKSGKSGAEGGTRGVTPSPGATRGPIPAEGSTRGATTPAPAEGGTRGIR